MQRSGKFSAMKRALGAKSGNSAKLGKRPPVEGSVREERAEGPAIEAREAANFESR